MISELFASNKSGLFGVNQLETRDVEQRVLANSSLTYKNNQLIMLRPWSASYSMKKKEEGTV